ncbi:MAG: SEC-C domain-containing protein, partial [Thermoguttaceae bacterium]|nr:SEC-C domain-containing protein [Thermoguttaceae bacterium]
DGVFERVTDYVYRIEQLDENFIGSTWSAANDPNSASRPQQAVSAEVQQTQRQQEEAIEASKDKKVETFRRKQPKVGRNDPCPCGSGKKYKNCCGKN